MHEIGALVQQADELIVDQIDLLRISGNDIRAYRKV
jgi:hypothetical protein